MKLGFILNSTLSLIRSESQEDLSNPVFNIPFINDQSYVDTPLQNQSE
jgi:hypothetical protein